MGIFNGSDDGERVVRAQMEAAEREAARERERLQAGGKTRPRRYRLYDRIADKVTVGQMNVVIVAVVILLIAAIAVGIATGTGR